MPRGELNISGRGNPQGIPYLYLASNEYTAVTEVKPFKTAEITIGVFSIKEDLNIADVRFSKLDSPFACGKDLGFVEVYKPFVNHISIELMKPVNPNKTDLNYIPTQYLCEKIKKLGYDGLIYLSYLGESNKSGDNLLLFNESKVECTESHKVRVSNISVDYDNIEIQSNDT